MADLFLMAVRNTYTKTHETSNGTISAIAEYTAVMLTHDFEHRGTRYLRGTRGTVVHKHNEDAFEVEFSQPKFSVVTLRGADIVAF
ncbi:DUF4926 domain-containing protein [Lacibacterium aquatile]|uniref:DUF4926 domain-containing protein n=1 Tax=Lacibacterium aquatile TaxID=1168082 RepID=A0ABW5DUT5_9PROT